MVDLSGAPRLLSLSMEPSDGGRKQSGLLTAEELLQHLVEEHGAGCTEVVCRLKSAGIERKGEWVQAGAAGGSEEEAGPIRDAETQQRCASTMCVCCLSLVSGAHRGSHLSIIPHVVPLQCCALQSCLFARSRLCGCGCLHVYAHLSVPVDVPAHFIIELRFDARGTRVGSRSSAGGYKRCVLGRLALAQSRMIAVTL